MTTLLLIVSGLLVSVQGHAQQSGAMVPLVYNQGDPTAEEQYLLERLNRARLDPVGEGQRLADWLLNTTEGRLNAAQFNINPEQVASDFAALLAVQPLAFNGDLIAAAQAHSADIAAHGGQGPGGDPDYYWDGESVDDHVYAVGYRTYDGGDGFDGGNAFGDVPDIDTIHAGYLIDWGNPDLGHRKLEMNVDPRMDVVGLGLATQPNNNLSDTEDYGKAAMACAFLTGVVYDDTNSNGLYDVGEGVAGVLVSVDGGTYSTVTSASGGYSLPLTKGDGTQFADNLTSTVTVHMLNLPGGGTRDATLAVTTATVSGGFQWPLNVKWDAQVALTNAADITLSGGGIISRMDKGKTWVLLQRPVGSDAAQPLEVSLAFKGTAIGGVDYKTIPAIVTIPVGAESLRLKVKALFGDPATRMPQTTLTIKVKGLKGPQGKATVTIVP